MARRTALRAVLATLALTAPTACSASSADKAGPTATVATEPPPTTTTTTNPYAVPAVIDVAYVNRVLAGLDALIGDTVRLIIQTQTIPPEAHARLRAIYHNDDLLQLSIDSFQNDIAKRFANYKPTPGNETTAVTQLLTARSSCIFAKVSRDYAAVGAHVSAAAGIEWVALQRLQPRHDPAGYNPTGWTFIYEGFPPTRTEPLNPCTA